MTDDIRTRIAATIRREVPCHPPAADRIAREVIRELGTDCIYRYACHQCGDFWFDKSERMQRFALLHGKAHADD